MSINAYRAARIGSVFNDSPEAPHKKAWFRAELIDLVRPDSFWPHPFSIEQAFEIFRWMVATGDAYRDPTRWGRVGVRELLSATSGTGADEVTSITSLADLRTRFHHALLASPRCPAVVQWRKDHRVEIGARIRVRSPVYTQFEGARHLGFGSEGAIKDTLDRITIRSRGQTLKARLNYVHLDVETVHGVSIAVSAKGFVFRLKYGDPFHDNRPYSAWSHSLARTRPGETFLETFARARDVYDMLMGATDPCDAADFLGDRSHGPKWYWDYLTAYIAGDRSSPKPNEDSFTTPATRAWLEQQRAAQVGTGSLQ